MDLHQNKKERLLSLPTGKGLTFLLDQAAAILGNPVLAHDMDYKLLAYTQNVISCDPIWNEFITNGTVGQDRINFYKNECFFDEAANARKVTYLCSDKLPYDRIFGKLFNRDGIQIGCACITGSQNAFEQEDAPLFECLCDILSREISADDFFTSYGQEYQEKLINKLINREIDDKGIYTAHVESLYINMEENIYIAVVDFNGSDNPVIYRNLFKSVCPNIKYSVYGSYLIMLISYSVPCTNFPQFDRLLSLASFRAGISKGFDNLFDVSEYYHQAVCALRTGLASNADQHVFLYDR